jgi:hypothetical protein
MPVTKIKIKFDRVWVDNDGDVWGDGEWKFNAQIDGTQVGDPNHEFNAVEGQWIDLPEAQRWFKEVDVSAKGPGTTVRATFSGVDVDVFSDDDLGQVTAEFAFPYRAERTFPLTSPTMPGGFLRSAYQAYKLQITVSVVEMIATTTLSGPTSISVSRQADGSSTLSTINGTAVTPRVEVCPVVPVPANAFTRLPQRPALPGGLTPGAATAHAATIPLSPAPAALNALVNPSVIPILAATDANLDNKVARLAVTYVEPGNLDVNMLTWHITSGPAVFVGENRGPLVKVRGTGTAADTMAEFEVRWDGQNGPLLAKYRAWVGKVGRIPYRINLLDGNNAASMASSLLSPADVDGHMQVAKVIYWQIGLLFEADTNATLFEGAVASGTTGVYNVTVLSNNHTRMVNMNLTPAATRYNFRPGVINIAYIRSTVQQRAVASDIQGVSGNDENLDGTPSTSWVKPSGVTMDAAAKKVTMKTFSSSKRQQNKGPGDGGFIVGRHTNDASFTAATMGQLYACMIPSDWWQPNRQDQSGVNLAHELGHVLGLRHRGSGDSGNPPRSDDGVNSPDLKNKTRGHPWHENIMTYGYGGNADPPINLDLDLIQAAVVRRHPAIVY